MTDLRLSTKLLLQAGRLLLEYNESTAAIHRALKATARALTNRTCQVAVTYRGVAVYLAEEQAPPQAVRELRFNNTVQARVHEILDQVRGGQLEAAAALDRLERVERETPRHPRWLTALVLGAAGAGLAALLGADAGATMVAGLATGVGWLVRQEMGRRHLSLLLLPFTAALLGAISGGLAIRLGWTDTPELAVIVPALMVVPGPHLINGLLDLIDNHLPMSLARFGLAVAILLASAVGIIVGMVLTLPDPVTAIRAGSPDEVSLLADLALAGLVTFGFAVVYNTAWPQLWMATLGGMAGHGLRYFALEAGFRLEVATFFGGLAVGVVSAFITRFRTVPVAVVAFAGAVTMMPGLYIFRALGGGLRIAQSGKSADLGTVASTLGNGFQATLVVAGLALGLILGARAVQVLTVSREARSTAGAGPRPEEVTHHRTTVPVDQP
jgi:uncharacterized membrane protein YjjP (DUF1212 family)